MFLWISNVIENIHSKVYSLLIDKYVKDVDEKNKHLMQLTNTLRKT